MADRYSVEDGSDSGHCCFDASVLDEKTQKPRIAICECLDRESAIRICKLLNDDDKLLGEQAG